MAGLEVVEMEHRSRSTMSDVELNAKPDSDVGVDAKPD
jgi:hypothetical protein